MRVFITTVAGQSTRFNQGCSEPVLKCLYRTERTPECILCRLLRQAVEAGFDRLIVVGGYRFGDLQGVVDEFATQSGRPVELVYNPRWSDGGSMYSLYYGVQAAAGAGEILFFEGDILTDDKGFRQISAADRDAFAIVRDPIIASRSVVGYQGLDDRLHYLYSTQHGAITFPTSVKAVFHSAQAWKVRDAAEFCRLNAQLSEAERCGTNLVLIGQYFGRIPIEELSSVILEHWINCNTREDFALFECYTREQ